MARWLVGVELGMGIGVILFMYELTELWSDWMVPQAESQYGVSPALLIAALIALGSLSVTVLAAALDAWGSHKLPESSKASHVYLQRNYRPSRTYRSFSTSTTEDAPPGELF